MTNSRKTKETVQKDAYQEKEKEPKEDKEH